MMGLIPYESSARDMFKLMDEMERNFFGPFGGYKQASRSLRSFRTDIRDCGDKFVMEAEMPGFKKEEITIDLTGDVLTVSAEHEDRTEDKDGTYVSRERRYGCYKRSFDVTGIKTEGISAAYNDGILTLELPKMEQTAPETRKIELS